MGSKLIHFSIETLPSLRVIGKTTRVKEPTTLEDPTIEQLWDGMFKNGDLAYLLSLPGRYSSSADRVGWMGDFQPGDNAYTYLAGLRYIVHRSRHSPQTASAAPGTIVAASPAGGLHVACGGGTALELLDIQLEGKRVMSARDAMASKALTTGARFTNP